MDNNQTFYREYKAKLISTVELLIIIGVASLLLFYTRSLVSTLAMIVILLMGNSFRSKNQRIIISGTKIVLGSIAYAFSGSVSGEINNMQRISMSFFFLKITCFNNEKQKKENILLPRWLYSTKTFKDIAQALHTINPKIEITNI